MLLISTPHPLKAIDKGTKRYGEGNSAYIQFGEFFDTTKEDGTDREQRAAADKYSKQSLTNPRVRGDQM
jgi:hypothetical protein